MTTYANDAELRDAIARRDAQNVSPQLVTATDPQAWLEMLKLDATPDEAPTVWLSVTTAPATVGQVKGSWCPGPERDSSNYSSRYVTATYLSRGQMNTLSAYCGVVWQAGDKMPAEARDKSETTGKKIQEVMRKVQTGLARFKGLQVRSGSAMHLHTGVEGWQARPDAAIEVPPQEVCADCGIEIYFSNGHWRDSAGKFDAVKPGRGRDGRPISVFDHEHAVEVPTAVRDHGPARVGTQGAPRR